MERQQVGRNTWKKLGEIPGVPSYRDIDVDHGRKYCYRVRAVTAEGTSEAMETDDMQAGTLGKHPIDRHEERTNCTYWAFTFCLLPVKQHFSPPPYVLSNH